MIGQARLTTKQMAELCRRLSISLAAGVDVRTVWSREASHASGAAREHFFTISQGVDRGHSISACLDQTGDFFPKFFRELVLVGEKSGHLPEVFRRLSDHYDNQQRMRRNFLSAIAWPVTELLLALAVVGGLIFAMGAIPQLAKQKDLDLLGFGLKGTSGLLIYVCFLAAIGGVCYAMYRATSQGLLWVAPVQMFLMRVPQLGRALQTLAISRMAWTMHVTLNSGMDLLGALRLSVDSTHNVVYMRHLDSILRSVRAGNEIHEALTKSDDFPLDFVDAVRVGEESGNLVESMGMLANRYQDEARAAMNVITMLMGVAVFMLIGAILIFLIYQVFSQAYLAPLNDALKMR